MAAIITLIANNHQGLTGAGRAKRFTASSLCILGCVHVGALQSHTHTRPQTVGKLRPEEFAHLSEAAELGVEPEM